MKAPRTRNAIISEFKKRTVEVREYFAYFIRLAKDFPWDVVIAYLFSRVELAQNMTIYCGCVKCHKVNSSLAWKAINGQHMTRQGFKELYKKERGQIFQNDK